MPEPDPSRSKPSRPLRLGGRFRFFAAGAQSMGSPGRQVPRAARTGNL